MLTVVKGKTVYAVTLTATQYDALTARGLIVCIVSYSRLFQLRGAK